MKLYCILLFVLTLLCIQASDKKAEESPAPVDDKKTEVIPAPAGDKKPEEKPAAASADKASEEAKKDNGAAGLAPLLAVPALSLALLTVA